MGSSKKLVTIGIMALVIIFGIQILSYLGFTGQTIRLRPGNVENITLYYENVPYTLNFEQQEKLVAHINRALFVPKLTSPPRENIYGVNRIIIRRFSDPEILLIPISTDENNTYFSSPDWIEEGYLVDVAGSELKQLFIDAHD